KKIGFQHACWIFDPLVLTQSLAHDGSGDTPGIKHLGEWDLRPHRERFLMVDDRVLLDWQQVSGEVGEPLDQVKLLYPVTTVEQVVISALAAWRLRLGALNPAITSGYHESGAKQSGLIRASFEEPLGWSDVILRGPQFAISTPFAKQPPHTLHTDKPIGLVA